MVYDRESYHITFNGQSGTSGAGADIWSFGVKAAALDGAALPAPVQFLLGTSMADLRDAYTAFHSSADGLIAPGALFTSVKVARLGFDGKYNAEPAEISGFSNAGGGSSAQCTSPACSVCVSLWSGQTLGEANHGRLYLPWTSLASAAATGQMSAPQQGGILSGMTTFLGAVEDEVASVAAGTKLHVMSAKGAGTSKQVLEVGVGLVVDTQRRRRNRIADTKVYSSL